MTIHMPIHRPGLQIYQPIKTTSAPPVDIFTLMSSGLEPTMLNTILFDMNTVTTTIPVTPSAHDQCATDVQRDERDEHIQHIITPATAEILGTKKTLNLLASVGSSRSRILSPGRYIHGTGVECFPPELIREILVWYCSSPAKLPACGTSSDAFTFGRVCRMWREVASCRKDVWSSLRFEWAQCTPMTIAQESAIFLAHVLELSGSRPLGLHLSISALRLDVIQLQTPLLESFTIQSKSKHPHMTVEIQWPNTPFMNRLSAPLLRRAAFLDDAMIFTHPEILPWDQLCELDLLGLSVSISFNAYAKILRGAGSLRKLRLSLDRSLESDEPIILDNLEILHIIELGDSPSVPQYHFLMCERLVELSVEYTDGRAFDDDAEHTLTDILGTINHLQRLSLQNVPLSEEGLMRTLSHCPRLTYLAIGNNESSDFSLPLNNRTLCRLLISRNHALLPDLEHVFFTSKVCSDLCIEKFVASRWNAPNTTTRLRSFVYSSLGMVPTETLLYQLERFIQGGLAVKVLESDD